RRDLDEWRSVLDGVGVTFGIVGTVNEVLDDQQMRDSGALVPFADGEHLTVSSPFHIDGVDKVPAQRAPDLGQHSEIVLREAGYAADEIARLRTLGVLT
ncbi:MAG TPA: CoA transferase, partial [Acetobacteraceae bacterium]|nr:CoA transferase [Acetobacteraceae bacterium]